MDELVKPESTLQQLSALRPSFKKDGTVTAGNASGINDGAVSLVLAGEDSVKSKQVKPLARIVSWGINGVDPNIMGIGPVPASQKALAKATLSIEDMDLVEINEAFASQYLAVEKELSLDREKTNVNGVPSRSAIRSVPADPVCSLPLRTNSETEACAMDWPAFASVAARGLP